MSMNAQSNRAMNWAQRHQRQQDELSTYPVWSLSWSKAHNNIGRESRGSTEVQKQWRGTLGLVEHLTLRKKKTH